MITCKNWSTTGHKLVVGLVWLGYNPTLSVCYKLVNLSWWGLHQKLICNGACPEKLTIYICCVIIQISHARKYLYYHPHRKCKWLTVPCSNQSSEFEGSYLIDICVYDNTVLLHEPPLLFLWTLRLFFLFFLHLSYFHECTNSLSRIQNHTLQRKV